jgi:hypothetical protein
MKVTQLIGAVCSVVLAALLLVGCESKGMNKSDDYHDNDMQRTDAPARGADHGHYKDK